MNQLPRSTLRLFGFASLVCLLFGTALADPVLDWNEIALQSIRIDRTAPPMASRGLAMVHLAIASASQLVDLARPIRSEHGNELARIAAVSCAAHDVLVALFPAQKENCDRDLERALATIPDGSVKTRAVQLGRLTAARVLAERADDGWDAVVIYTPGSAPGGWRPTPPGFLPALLPQWPFVTPFVLPSGDALRPDGPPALPSTDYSEAFAEVASVGSKTSATRTAEQTQIALFWADGGGTETPPGHWNRIAHDVSISRSLSPRENATLFALLNVALADAAIAAWDAKYAHNFWRPVAAIREAGTDGNDATMPDPTWEPLITTPPFPSYVSGHSTFSGAAAELLSRFFGTDEIRFTTTSDGLPGIVREFASFTAAAREAGVSRIYGGIHYSFDDLAGQRLGREIADEVWSSYSSRRLVIQH